MKVVEKGRNAVLVCEAGGEPSPTITWIKDTMPVDLSGGQTKPRISMMQQGKLRGERQLEVNQEEDVLSSQTISV